MSEGRDYDITATMTSKCLLSGEGREWGIGELGEEWRPTDRTSQNRIQEENHHLL